MSIHLEPKWSTFDLKHQPETAFNAQLQNITKHKYLPCFVEVGHLRKHPWASTNSTKYQPKVKPSKIYKKNKKISGEIRKT